MLSGCTHRCCDRDNRYRGQSDHQFAYHRAHSSVRLRTPAFKVKLKKLRYGCPRAAVPRSAARRSALNAQKTLDLFALNGFGLDHHETASWPRRGTRRLKSGLLEERRALRATDQV
jgi:hypothetical protein